MVHHQKRINRLLHASSTQRVAGQRFCRRNWRAIGPEHRADRFNFLRVADGRRCRVRVDIVDLGVNRCQRLTHAADRALARWGYHVVAVRRCAIADDFGVNFCTAGLGVLQFFEHQNACAARNHKAVTVFIIGARSGCWRVVIFRRHRAHRVEQLRHRPIQLFATTGKHHILLAPLDHFIGVANAMVGGRAGRRDRIIHALDFKPGRKCGRCG